MDQVLVEEGQSAPSPEKTLHGQVVRIIAQDGLEHRDEPFRLSSGQWSKDYIDGKRALADGANMALVAQAILQVVERASLEFEAVGGLTMGADTIAHTIAFMTSKKWFSVRKQPKEHGQQRMIEGALLRPGTQVLLVDDVATTGGSIMDAVKALKAVHAEIVMAIALVDRGDATRERLGREQIRYEAMMTYKDLGISPVG